MTLDHEDIDAIADAVVRKLRKQTMRGDDGPLTAMMLASADDPIAAIRARNRALKAIVRGAALKKTGGRD